MLKESISRHIITIHLEDVWECQGCEKELIRNDAYGWHGAKSSSATCQTPGIVISCSTGTREIDTCAATLPRRLCKGYWIDKEETYLNARQGVTNVHESQFAKSSDPCSDVDRRLQTLYLLLVLTSTNGTKRRASLNESLLERDVPHEQKE